MPRGYPVSVRRMRPGKRVKTCGKCPCCRARAEFNTAKWKKLTEQRKKSDAISDEELERRLNAKFTD